MRTEELELVGLLREILPHRPDPDNCLSETTIELLMSKRSEMELHQHEIYDLAVSHVARCRACALKLKNRQLDDPDYLVRMGRRVAKEAEYRKLLDTVNVTLTYLSNEKTGKQELHVHYVSPSYLMAYEHEEMHRCILERLLDLGVVSSDDADSVVITREEAHGETQEDFGPASERILSRRKSKKSQGSGEDEGV